MSVSPVPSSTEVSVSASRRRFTVEYKIAIVQEAAQCRAVGEIGALLRREGLISSQLTTWRKQYHAGVRQALAPPRGPKVTSTPASADVVRLVRELVQVREQLARAEMLISIQKKLAELMGTPITAGGEIT